MENLEMQEMFGALVKLASIADVVSINSKILATQASKNCKVVTVIDTKTELVQEHQFTVDFSNLKPVKEKGRLYSTSIYPFKEGIFSSELNLPVSQVITNSPLKWSLFGTTFKFQTTQKKTGIPKVRIEGFSKINSV